MSGPNKNMRPSVSVSGDKILVDGRTFNMKGVNWNPIPIGVNQDDKDRSYFDVNVDLDAILMEDLGVNLVRTYEPILDITVLDKLYARNIYVMSPIYIDADVDLTFSVTNTIQTTKNHPAVLLWYIGNEWNYNNLYSDTNNFDDCVALINQAAAMAKQLDTTRPVATIYGELPSTQLVAQMPDIDIWGLNVYRGIGFGSLFRDWELISGKPMFIGEYGADAYNALIGGEDQASHARATTELTQLIFDESTVKGGSCSGGIIFEFNDEWWKAGNDFTHDTGGIAPGGGPYPDQTFNEEWWGLTEIDRKPREAYFAFKAVVNPTVAVESTDSSESSAPIIAAAFVVAALLIGAVSFFAYKKNKKPEAPAPGDIKATSL